MNLHWCRRPQPASFGICAAAHAIPRTPGLSGRTRSKTARRSTMTNSKNSADIFRLTLKPWRVLASDTIRFAGRTITRSATTAKRCGSLSFFAEFLAVGAPDRILDALSSFAETEGNFRRWLFAEEVIEHLREKGFPPRELSRETRLPQLLERLRRTFTRLLAPSPGRRTADPPGRDATRF